MMTLLQRILTWILLYFLLTFHVCDIVVYLCCSSRINWHPLYIVPLKLLCTHRQSVYIHVGACVHILSYILTQYVSYILWEWIYRYSKAMECCFLDIYVYKSCWYTVYTHVYVWVLNGNLLHWAKCCPYWNMVHCHGRCM